MIDLYGNFLTRYQITKARLVLILGVFATIVLKLSKLVIITLQPTGFENTKGGLILIFGGMDKKFRNKGTCKESKQ